MVTQEALSQGHQPEPSAPLRTRLPIHALWATSLVSIFGNAMTGIAVPWFVLETTGSASRTGITAAATVLPVILAQLVGGALVDRTSYRGMSVFSDLLSAATVAAIPALYLTIGLNFGALLALMFLGALFDAPGNTARAAMVPPLSRLTGIPLERINATFSMISATSFLVAAPLAGLLVAWLGPIAVLWVNAGTFVVAALLVLLCVPALTRAEPSDASFLADVRNGFAYMRTQPILRALVLGFCTMNFLFAPLFGVALPWFANQELHSVRSLGIILGSEGVGALVGAFLYGRFGERLGRHTFLKAALALVAIPIVPMAFATSVWDMTACVVLIGTGTGLVNPMFGTILQMTTPAHLLGRMTGLSAAGSLVGRPIGVLLGGVLISLLGFTGATLMIAALMTTMAVALATAPVMRGLDALPAQGRRVAGAP
jgi:MFS family permease